MTKKVLFVSPLIGLAMLLVSFLTLSFANPVTQPGSNAGWEDGRPITTSSTQTTNAMPAVATTPGVSYRTFSGISFQPTSSDLTYASIGGAIYATALPVGAFSFSVDLDLPHGAQITEVVFFVIDNDATKNMSLNLRAYNPATDSFTSIASATTTGASSNLQTIVIPVNPPVQVDNTTTAYRLRVEPGVIGSAHLLRGARIGYIVAQVFLPMISAS